MLDRATLPGSAPPPGRARLGPVMLIPRRIPGGVAAMLDALPPDALPRLRFEGPVAALRRALRAALAERLPRPRWLSNWMLDDVLDKASLVAELADAAVLRVALDAGDAGGGAPFAVADARLRLVTSYRGPGAEWVSPRFMRPVGPGAAPPAGALRHLARGDVAVLRGGGSRDGPGVPHRDGFQEGAAPPLRLTIDAVDRPGPAARPGRGGRRSLPPRPNGP